jgi:hypothetical protein
MFSFLTRTKRADAHFLHIGKSGGSAIKSALTSCPNTPRYRIHLHKHEVTLADVPEGQKVFFCLRDPVSRFVSGFYSRQRKGQPRYYVEWTPGEKAAYETFATPNELALSLAETGDDPDSPASRAMSAVKHLGHYSFWYRDIPYFKSRLDDILFIGFQDSLDADFVRLKHLLDVPEHVVLPTDDVAAHRNTPTLDRNLDPAARAALEQWYAEDFAFVEYCRQLQKQRIEP